MGIFRCSKCGCIENTALSNFWFLNGKWKKALCSECDPKIKKWHGRFDKQSAKGLCLSEDGFLYDKSEPAVIEKRIKIIKVLK